VHKGRNAGGFGVYRYLPDRWAVTSQWWPNFMPARYTMDNAMTGGGLWDLMGTHCRQVTLEGEPNEARDSVTYPVLTTTPSYPLLCSFSYQRTNSGGPPFEVRVVLQAMFIFGPALQQWVATGLTSFTDPPNGDVATGRWQTAQDVASGLPVALPPISLHTTFYFEEP